VRRRILRAILLAVAVTGFVLGIPLGYTALQLVEDTARGSLTERAQQIATTSSPNSRASTSRKFESPYRLTVASRSSRQAPPRSRGPLRATTR
jgi:hypothetical protein